METPGEIWARFLSRNFWRLFACAVVAIAWYNFDAWLAAWKKNSYQSLSVHFRDETDAATLILKRPQQQFVPGE